MRALIAKRYNAFLVRCNVDEKCVRNEPLRVRVMNSTWVTTRSSSRGPPSRFRIVGPSRDVILNFERHANGLIARGGGRTERFSPNSYRRLCDMPLARSFSCIFHRLNVSWYVALRGFSEYNDQQKVFVRNYRNYRNYRKKLLRVYCTYYTYTHMVYTRMVTVPRTKPFAPPCPERLKNFWRFAKCSSRPICRFSRHLSFVLFCLHRFAV